jgi:AP-1-like transcription factor
MAGTSNNQQFNSQLYLSPNQQDLLMAALNSNNHSSQNAYNSSQNFKNNGPSQMDMSHNQHFALDGLDPSFFSAQQDANTSEFNGFNVQNSPFVDFLDGENNFDFADPEGGELMMGSIEGEPSPEEEHSPDADGHDKRKSPEDDDEHDNGEAKRQHPEDKTAKKPGRKPLTSEPTTVSLILKKEFFMD